jgi:Zn finger protein HypA/HybF involved in hydrogenase expression
MSKKSEAKPAAKPEVSKEPELVKCINCEVMLPKHTGVCPNCSYRQPHPGWS